MVDTVDNCLSKLKYYVENKTVIFNILTRYVSLLILFFFSFLCCLSLASYDKLLLEKMISLHVLTH